MVSVTSLGFLPFMALFVCLWYRVPQPSRWKLVLAANAVFCLSIDIGAFFAVALATAVVWQAAQHAQPEQPSRRGWLALGLAAALLPLLVLKYSGMLVPGLRDLYKPFGLAYYSLQLAGYLLDVWHGRTAPTRPKRPCRGPAAARHPRPAMHGCGAMRAFSSRSPRGRSTAIIP